MISRPWQLRLCALVLVWCAACVLVVCTAGAYRALPDRRGALVPEVRPPAIAVRIAVWGVSTLREIGGHVGIRDM